LPKKKAKAERVLPTLGQLAELLKIIVAIAVKVFKKMDKSTAQYWIGRERELSTILDKILLRGSAIVDEKVADWVKFYHEIFGLDLDPTEIKLPTERDGFRWIILVAKDLTRNEVFGKCLERFKNKA